MTFKKSIIRKTGIVQYSADYMGSIYDVVLYGGEFFYQKNLCGFSCQLAKKESIHDRVIEHFTL